MKNLLSLVSIAMLAVVIVLVATMPRRCVQPAAVTGVMGHEGQIEFAHKLLSKGLKAQAAEVFEGYLAHVRIAPLEEAKLLYQLGGIYMEIYKYEKALMMFYKAEMVAPKTDFTDEMNRKIVEALENLGMGAQARYETQARTSLGGAREPEGAVVARIGKRQITDAEIDQALASVPQWMRKRFEEPDRRREFITEYVAREILYSKAKRLGLDSTGEVRRTLEQVKKQIVVDELVRKEIGGKLEKITPEDVKLYFDAHQETLGVEPAQIKIRYARFTGEPGKEEALKKVTAGEGTAVDEWIPAGAPAIPGIGEAKEALAVLFQKEKNQVSDPVKIKDAWYVFLLVDKKEKRQKSFDEAKLSVEYEYRMKKERNIADALFKKALEEEEVEILYAPPKDEHATTQE